MQAELAQARLEQTRAEVHPHCIACAGAGGPAARLSFVVQPDLSVVAQFPGGYQYQGYCDMLHGGVIATLLDAAMTNCLFAHGEIGVTADLHVRYRKPVTAAQPATLRAWLDRSNSPLFVIKAELVQADVCKVTATGKFVQKRPQTQPDADVRSVC